MKLLLSGLALLLIVSMVSAYEWEVVELGGADSANPYTGGTVDVLANGLTMTAAGGEFWSGKLGGTLALFKGGLSGDFTLEYTITDHTNDPPNNWGKFGVMMLEELDPDSAFVYVQASLPSNRPDPSYGARIIGRTQGTDVDFNAGGTGWLPLTWPMTHKLVRSGDVFTASISMDGGATYQSLDDGAGSPDNVEFAFADPMIIGFGICGKGANPGVSTATVVDIKIDGQLVTAVQSEGKLLTTWAELKR